MTTCVFCDIIEYKAPAEFLADSIGNIAIVPLKPVTPGHFIVIPRQHVTDALDDSDVTGHCFKDAAHWTESFSRHNPLYESVNFITSVGRPATQSVFHLHIHVVPRAVNDGLALPWYSGRTRPKNMR